MNADVASRHVLIIKLGALGDVVLAVPQLLHILDAHPTDTVTLLTSPDYVDLVAGIPRLKVVAFRRRGFIEMCRVLLWLSGRSFETVYDLQGSLRSRVMTLVTQAEKRVGARPGVAYTQVPASTAVNLHAFEQMNAVLVAGGIGAALPEPLPVAPAVETRVDEWLQDQALQGKRLVLVHAGASRRWPSKRWDENYFLQLAQALESRGLVVIWTGASDERELNKRLASQAGVDATGVFSVTQLVALASRAAFAISNDSGPMHLFSAAGIPVYAFFGPTDWQRSHALGQAERVLVNPVSCSPCTLRVCPPEKEHACMHGMAPVTVLDRLKADGLIS